MRTTKSFEAREFEHVFPEPNTGCWIWASLRDTKGYGVYRFMDKKVITSRQAYRVFYERYRGPIPNGLVLDHLCRVRCCVNPQHLEPVTIAENTRRGIVANRMKTHCKNGHPLSGNNIRSNASGARICIPCAKEYMRAYNRNRKPPIKLQTR